MLLRRGLASHLAKFGPDADGGLRESRVARRRLSDYHARMPMTKRPYGSTGFQVSPLGFGGAPIGFLGIEREHAAGVLNALLDAGVNLIDTAASYKDSEGFIGESIGNRRDEFVLVSKCGGKIEGLDAPEWSPELISMTVDRSLKALRTNQIDVMLLHSCSRQVLERGDALRALVKAREAGKVRCVGYSGDNETAAYAATLPDIAAIQTSISIADQRNIDVVLPKCRERNLGVEAKRPIANAAWKDLDQQPGMYKKYAKTYTDRLKQMKLDITDLGFDDTSDGWSEMALRFTLSQPGVSTAIIGTTNLAHAQKNILAAGKGPLPGPVIQKIRDAFKRAEGSGEWTGQT